VKFYPLLASLKFVILLPALVLVELLAHHSVSIIDRHLLLYFT